MKYRLKSNVVIEPLVARYAASPYLLSPCSAPRFFRRLVDRILGSYVKSARAHEVALQNPAFKGGPFVALASTKVDQAAVLLNELRDKLHTQLEAAQALDELAALLATAEGQSLDSFYDRVPAILKGLVELYYERSERASYRMHESLAYQSELYNSDLQEIMLYELQDDHRDFVLTTPRLDAPRALFLQIPFDSECIDALSRARMAAIDDVDLLAKQLGVSAADLPKFKALFDEDNTKEQLVTQICHGDFRTRYFGHACVEVTSGSTTVLVDPFVSYKIPGQKDERFTLEDLPGQIDALIITHLHLDHFCIETLLQLRHKTKLVIVPKTNGGSPIDPSAKLTLRALGFKNIVELSELESHFINNIEVMALPFQGEHGNLDISSKATFLVRTEYRSAIFAADVRIVSPELLQRISRMVPHVDTIFVGMECEGAPLSWVYGSLLDRPLDRKFDQERRLNGSNSTEAMAFVKNFSATKVRIYALGREPWLSHIMSVVQDADSVVTKEISLFLCMCEDSQIDAKVLYISDSEGGERFESCHAG